jgi:mannose-6-phosphate isomerase-like protein (cupin superfamily)
MLDEKKEQGTNFTGFHAGSMESWSDFCLEPPHAPIKMNGKLFLRNLLQASGVELSLNVVPPAGEMPFQHRHQLNEEIYIVVGGHGQFLVDGERLDVAEGSFLRISPPAARTWRNNSNEPLYFLCLQYREDSKIESGGADGRKVEAKAIWPN